MSLFVESLKRLFDAGEIAFFKIDDYKKRGVITEEEYRYITGDTE